MSVLKTEAGQMALANLEQMQPRYLADLMRENQVEQVLAGKVTAFINLRDKLERTMPPEAASEIAQAEFLTPVNPNWEDEEPLTPEEERMLNAYRGS